MGKAHGSVVGMTKIHDSGPVADRWNLVLLGDGYQSGELGTFVKDAHAFVTRLLATAPFHALASAINVYRIDVISNDSGADDPAPAGGTGAVAATYFDATFGGAGIRRLLLVNHSIVNSVVNAFIPEASAKAVLVNSKTYGGSGGWLAVFSTAPSADEIGLHELGHVAFGLSDEYDYFAKCRESGRDHYPGPEPQAPNVTRAQLLPAIKWNASITPFTPLPTSQNPNCGGCDTQAATVKAGTVGLFEGASTYHCKIYRPEFDCRMRTLGAEFCAVCQRQITRVLSPYMPTT
jgi:hypothetical protein